MESFKEEGDFLGVSYTFNELLTVYTLVYFILIFDKKFSCYQGIWKLVCDEFVSVLIICLS